MFWICYCLLHVQLLLFYLKCRSFSLLIPTGYSPYDVNELFEATTTIFSGGTSYVFLYETRILLSDILHFSMLVLFCKHFFHISLYLKRIVFYCAITLHEKTQQFVDEWVQTSMLICWYIWYKQFEFNVWLSLSWESLKTNCKELGRDKVWHTWKLRSSVHTTCVWIFGVCSWWPTLDPWTLDLYLCPIFILKLPCNYKSLLTLTTCSCSMRFPCSKTGFCSIEDLDMYIMVKTFIFFHSKTVIKLLPSLLNK